MRGAVMVALLVVGLATGATAATSAPVPGSCQTAGSHGECQFSCSLGDVIAILVQGTSPSEVPASSAHCGGVFLDCTTFVGCAKQSSQTTVPGIGDCSTTSQQAVTTCTSTLNPLGLSSAWAPGCTVTVPGQSCYFRCVEPQRLSVSAQASRPYMPASAVAACGGQEAVCSGTGSCTASSAERVALVGLGACRAYSAATSATCAAVP